MSLSTLALAASGEPADQGGDFRFRCKLGVTLVEVALHRTMGSVESEWRQFEQTADCTAFQSYDWMASWQKHIGHRVGTVPAIIVGRLPDRTPLFIFPLALGAGFANRLTWLGSDLCDYNGPLLAPTFAEIMPTSEFDELWMQILDLIKTAQRIDLIQLEKMPELVGRQRNPFTGLGTSVNPNGAYLAHLHGTWDEFYQVRRSSSRRKGDRNRTRRLAEHGSIQLVSPQSLDDIKATMQVLFRQKSKSLADMGAPDLFSRPGYRDFFLDLATNLACGGLVHVSRLEVGSVWAATNFGLQFRGSFYHVLCSYEQGNLAPFGPGSAHLRELLRYALDRNLDRFDFTIGDEPYKLEWADTKLQLHDHFSAVSSRGYPAEIATRAKQNLKRKIKQSRLLWAAIERMRRLIGARRNSNDMTRPDRTLTEITTNKQPSTDGTRIGQWGPHVPSSGARQKFNRTTHLTSNGKGNMT